MDAISYLLKEHRKFRKTFAAISKISHKKASKKTKFAALCKDLIQHETMEQKVWYPRLRKNKVLKDVIKHLVSEEKSAAKSIKSFKKVKSEIMWQLKFIKLRMSVDHHAREEEKKLFPKVRKLYPKAELSELGTKMRKFKTALKKKQKGKKLI